MGIGYSSFEANVVLPTPATNRALRKLIVAAVFTDCRLMLLLDTFMETAEGFGQFALSFQFLALCETGIVICHKEEKLGGVVALNRIWAPNINMNKIAEFCRLALSWITRDSNECSRCSTDRTDSF
jgi:hypothetical protein